MVIVGLIKVASKKQQKKVASKQKQLLMYSLCTGTVGNVCFFSLGFSVFQNFLYCS